MLVDVSHTVEHGIHLVQKEKTPTTRLFHGLLQDLARQASDLDVHLQRGNALPRSGDFEVHVAIMVFCSGNVGENGVIVTFLHQAHGHARYRTRERDARIVKRETRAAD